MTSNDNPQTDRETHPAQLEACACGRSDSCLCNKGIVCARDVSFAYGAETVLDNITLCVPQECMVGVIGPNGGGKTTLLKLILGLLKPQSGAMDVFGRPAAKLGRLRSHIGYVPQRLGLDPNFPASAKDIALSGCFGQLGMFERLPAHRRDRTAELMELTGMTEYADRPIGELSFGQQQRVFITRALVADPKLLIVDEPISGVDTAGQIRFFELIQSLRKELKLTVIMVSHNVDQLIEHADFLACLNKTLHWHDTDTKLDIRVLEEIFGCELHAHVDHYHAPGEEH